MTTFLGRHSLGIRSVSRRFFDASVTTGTLISTQSIVTFNRMPSRPEKPVNTIRCMTKARFGWDPVSLFPPPPKQPVAKLNSRSYKYQTVGPKFLGHCLLKYQPHSPVKPLFCLLLVAVDTFEGKIFVTKPNGRPRAHAGSFFEASFLASRLLDQYLPAVYHHLRRTTRARC